jgi:hypothetical protein
LFAIPPSMPRRRRIQFPGAVHHVMARGNRKSMIVDDDDDRQAFMDAFGRAAIDHEVRVYSCCLMGTHYHALLDTPRGNVSDFARTGGEPSPSSDLRGGVRSNARMRIHHSLSDTRYR